MENNGLAKKAGDQLEKIGNKMEHSSPILKKVGDTVERAGDTVEHLGDRKLGATLGDKLGDKLNEKKADLPATADDVVSEGANWLSDATQKVRGFQSQTFGYIKARPVAFLVGAVAIGFLANRLLISRSTSTQSQNTGSKRKRAAA